MSSNKISKFFIPLEHDIEYDQSTPNSKYSIVGRIDTFLVNKTLSGNVNIVTTGEGQGNVTMLTDANVYSEYTFDATAFTVGQTYNMFVKKVKYGNVTDQNNPPLIGLI